MPKLSLKGTAATALGAIASVVSANGPAPSEAVDIIVSKVHSAAVRQDYVTLRSNMATEFTWSFGGDADAEQALAEWKKHPKYLKGLAKATQSKCGWIDRDIYQCPVKPGLALRAGFRQIEGRWKLVYFVEGD